MNERATDWPHRLLAVFFGLFVVTSTFSIALAQTSLGISLVVFILIAVRERYNPFSGPAKLVYLCIALYLVWLLLSSAMGRTPARSLLMCKEEWLFLAIPVGIYLLRDTAYRERIISAFAVAVGIVSIYALIEFVTGTHWLHFSGGSFSPIPSIKPTGNFTHWLTFANYYATAALFLFAYLIFTSGLSVRRYRLILAVAVLAILAVVLTSSRTPITAIVIALVVTTSFRPGRFRMITLGIVAVVLAAAILLPQSREKFGGLLQRDTSAEYEGSRRFIWTRSWDIVKQHPIFGVGQGNFKEEYVARLDPNIDESRKHAHAHNDLLNTAAIAGIPGALLFLGIWVVIIRKVKGAAFDLRLTIGQRRVAMAAFVGSVVFFMTSLTEATFADEEVRQLLMFVWAAGLAVQYNEGPGQKP